MGSGSTIAAATACGLRSVGIEMHREYFDLAVEAIPKLAALKLADSSRNGAGV
jgi:site-specific DNA-methyltransferase (adenine-specific)